MFVWIDQSNFCCMIVNNTVCYSMASWKSILTESHEVSSSSEEIVQLSNDLKSLDVDGSAYSIVNDNLILGSHCDQLTSNNDAHFEPFCTMYNLEHCIAYLNQVSNDIYSNI